MISFIIWLAIFSLKASAVLFVVALVFGAIGSQPDVTEEDINKTIEKNYPTRPTQENLEAVTKHEELEKMKYLGFIVTSRY